MLRFQYLGLLVCLLSVAFTGCCCVQGVAPAGACGSGACSTGSCGPGPLLGLLSCRGACGETYVDEWISEPPTVDNCGSDCGGCGVCGQCRPIRTALKLLWGRPYRASCSTGLCGPSCGSCDGGGEVYNDGYEGVVSHSSSGGCNCGGNHSSSSPMPMEISPATPMPQGTHEIVPTPAPEMPNSAKRLNPASRRTIHQVSTRR